MRGLGRLRGAAGLLLCAFVWCFAFVAEAQDAAPVGPVPGGPVPGSPATIVVFGDSQAQGLSLGLQRVLVEDPRFKVLNRTHPGAALVHGENEWLQPVEKFAARERADIAVVMFGANDRLDMRDAGAYLRFRTDEWRDTYAARADKILAALAKAGLRVLWCGNPIARSETYSNDMSYINDIFAAETARFGVQFVPLWSAVTDDQGRFAAYGKDRDGTTQRLRTDDGIHFTGAGYELVADKLVALLATQPAPATMPVAPPPGMPGAMPMVPAPAAATPRAPTIPPAAALTPPPGAAVSPPAAPPSAVPMAPAPVAPGAPIPLAPSMTPGLR